MSEMLAHSSHGRTREADNTTPDTADIADTERGINTDTSHISGWEMLIVLHFICTNNFTGCSSFFTLKELICPLRFKLIKLS